jgi:50S ribosomal subunit-associated GTPase HflX
LSKRPWCIIANKTDLPGAEENLGLLRERFPTISVVPISAERGEGITELKEHLALWMTDASGSEGDAMPVAANDIGTTE